MKYYKQTEITVNCDFIIKSSRYHNNNLDVYEKIGINKYNNFMGQQK